MVQFSRKTKILLERGVEKTVRCSVVIAYYIRKKSPLAVIQEIPTNVTLGYGFILVFIIMDYY
jgi:hypothetical protein